MYRNTKPKLIELEKDFINMFLKKKLEKNKRLMKRYLNIANLKENKFKEYSFLYGIEFVVYKDNFNEIVTQYFSTEKELRDFEAEIKEINFHISNLVDIYIGNNYPYVFDDETIELMVDHLSFSNIDMFGTYDKFEKVNLNNNEDYFNFSLYK